MVDLSSLGYNEENADEVWQLFRSITQERGRVINPELTVQIIEDTDVYPEDTLRHDLIPKLRRLAEAENIVHVEQEVRENQDGENKLVHVIEWRGEE